MKKKLFFITCMNMSTLFGAQAKKNENGQTKAIIDSCSLVTNQRIAAEKHLPSFDPTTDPDKSKTMSELRTALTCCQAYDDALEVVLKTLSSEHANVQERIKKLQQQVASHAKEDE